MIKSIVFDIDDTLVTHSLAIEKGIEEFYSRFFKNDLIELDDFSEMWQKQHKKYVKQYIKGEITFEEQRILRIQGIFKETGKSIDESLARKYFDYYLESYENNWKLFLGVKDCLENLNNYKLGILSNGDSEQQRQKLRKTKIINYFDSVVISGDLGITKPNKVIFNEIISKLDVEPNEIIYVGDNYEKDFSGADNAGLYACLINRDLNKSVELVGNNFKINSLDRLNEVLSVINRKG